MKINGYRPDRQILNGSFARGGLARRAIESVVVAGVTALAVHSLNKLLLRLDPPRREPARLTSQRSQPRKQMPVRND